ncbi:hypothetical protein [Thioalkalivibrio sp. HK1]|uniref:hypothetical protein n=1 Tax=Thioalkalivibrio sp. HK1 TaxID=1469245 RepID=UPI000471513C|nr:hypothetical protein [Thioalkalivibrio sp. HK1]
MSGKNEGIFVRNKKTGRRQLIPELRLHILKNVITREMNQQPDIMEDKENILEAGVTAAVLCSLKLDECEEHYIEQAEAMPDIMAQALADAIHLEQYYEMKDKEKEKDESK